MLLTCLLFTFVLVHWWQCTCARARTHVNAYTLTIALKKEETIDTCAYGHLPFFCGPHYRGVKLQWMCTD